MSIVKPKLRGSGRHALYSQSIALAGLLQGQQGQQGVKPARQHSNGGGEDDTRAFNENGEGTPKQEIKRKKGDRRGVDTKRNSELENMRTDDTSRTESFLFHARRAVIGSSRPFLPRQPQASHPLFVSTTLRAPRAATTATEPTAFATFPNTRTPATGSPKAPHPGRHAKQTPGAEDDRAGELGID